MDCCTRSKASATRSSRPRSVSTMSRLAHFVSEDIARIWFDGAADLMLDIDGPLRRHRRSARRVCARSVVGDWKQTPARTLSRIDLAQDTLDGT